MASTAKTGMAAKTKVAEKTSTKRKKPKKPSTEELLAAYLADLAQLKALITGGTAPVTASKKTPPVVELNLSEKSSWATKHDMPTFPEVKRLLWAGVRGKLHEDDEEVVHLVRELSVRACLLCGKASHASMAPDVPWSEVVLCDCKLMRSRKGREGKGFSEKQVARPDPIEAVLEGWATARHDPDGGINWLRTQMRAKTVRPEQIVYKGNCRCGADFPIYAGMIARAVQDHNLDVYIESRKCLPCARKAAAVRVANGVASKGVAPQKAQTGLTTLREVMPEIRVSDESNKSGITQQEGAA